jgi:hypothetical protein
MANAEFARSLRASGPGPMQDWWGRYTSETNQRNLATLRHNAPKVMALSGTRTMTSPRLTTPRLGSSMQGLSPRHTFRAPRFHEPDYAALAGKAPAAAPAGAPAAAPALMGAPKPKLRSVDPVLAQAGVTVAGVTAEEVRTAHAEVKARWAQKYDGVRKGWLTLDENNSNRIEKEEFKNCLLSLNLEYLTLGPVLQALMQLIDADQDRLIDYTEFQRFLTSNDILDMGGRLIKQVAATRKDNLTTHMAVGGSHVGQTGFTVGKASHDTASDAMHHHIDDKVHEQIEMHEHAQSIMKKEARATFKHNV